MKLYIEPSWITTEFSDLRYFHPFELYNIEYTKSISEECYVLQTVHDRFINHSNKILYHFEPHYRTPNWWNTCKLIICTHTEIPFDIRVKVLYYPFAFFYLNSHNYIPKVLSRPSKSIEFKHKKFCLFINSNGNAKKRIEFCQELMKYKKINCAGNVLNNCEIIKAPYYTEEFIEYIQQYKFMICFENSDTEGYFTEKIINAYIGNTVPIYWCNKSVHKYLNESSMVLLKEYNQEYVQKAIQEIILLDNNDELYSQKLKEPLFKNNTIPKEFELDYIKEQIQEALEC